MHPFSYCTLLVTQYLTGRQQHVVDNVVRVRVRAEYLTERQQHAVDIGA